MISTPSRLLWASLCISGLMLTGCPAPTPPANTTPKPDAKKEHDHGHDHAHVHKGPHGGHVAVVGKEQFHVEWTHNDETGKVAIYVLDAEAKKEIPVAAEKLVVIVKQDAKQTDKNTPYELLAVDPVDGKSAKFEIVAQDLIGALEALSEKITAEIQELEINGEKFSAVKLEEHEHHH